MLTFRCGARCRETTRPSIKQPTCSVACRCGARKTPFFAPCCTKNPTIYQDRLGTDMGSHGVETKCVFRRALHADLCRGPSPKMTDRQCVAGLFFSFLFLMMPLCKFLLQQAQLCAAALQSTLHACGVCHVAGSTMPCSVRGRSRSVRETAAAFLSFNCPRMSVPSLSWQTVSFHRM